jgi:hypothetical protein
VLVDALDEAEQELVDVLVEQAPKLPPWLRLVATTRPDAPVLNRVRALDVCELNADRPENRADLRAYIEARLAREPLGERVGAVPVARQLDELAAGNFLYARLTLDAIESGELSPADVGEMVPGLRAFYTHAFGRRFPNKSAFEDEYAPLLQMLAAAQAPLSFALLCRAVGGEAKAVYSRLAELRA